METVPPNPFKGLRSFEEKDRHSLFGRDRDLILMKDRIFSARTTLLFAGSGVGKTSFLNAKVVPELRKQCEVVWHNRWTGADEQEDIPELYEDRRMRFWPPRALFHALLRKLRLKRDEVDSEKTSERRSEPDEDQFASEVHKTITQSLRHSSGNAQRSLSEVLARFSKSAPNAVRSKDQKDRCILILDQFEEVFQYHAYEKYFDDFVGDLCQIINNQDYQVRIVFSMREEFLGELSIFDNKIPDLFNNYYRLKYPSKDEAADIIALTCQLSRVDPDEGNLEKLVDDLSKIEKGSGSFAERSTNLDEANTRVIKRNFVAPPYLQIACERLWNQQYGAAAESTAASSQQGPSDAPKFAKFLVHYQAGNGDAKGTAPGGDAQKALREFCQEKLSSPFLSPSQQDIAARAFSFLVTKQGAKMAYELRSLASHMDESVPPLKAALEKLSQDEAKILRETRGPDRSHWFELYHDMYATIVEDWKVKYLKRRRRRNLARVGVAVLILPGLLLLVLAALIWVINPRDHRRKLTDFKAQINGPNLEQQPGYRDAVSAFTSLENTPGYGQTARSLWADILERRAQWFAMNNDPTSALLSLLKAASMKSDAAEKRRLLKTAEVLMGTAGGSLIGTYCNDCASASLSNDGKSLLTMNQDGQVRLWDAGSVTPLGPPFCEYCTRSRPAARKALYDGKHVLTVGGVTDCDGKGPDDQSKTQTGLRIELWDSLTYRPLLSKYLCLDEGRAGAATSQTGPSVGRESASPRSQDTPPTIDVRDFVKVGNRLWMVGLKGQQICFWDEAGRETPLASVEDPDLTDFGFSSDGEFLLVSLSEESMKLWRVTEKEITPYPLQNVRALEVGLGHQLLIAQADTARIINADSESILREVRPAESAPAGAKLVAVNFSDSGDYFMTRMRDADGDTVQAWPTSPGAPPIHKPLRLLGHVFYTDLGSDGKTLLVVDGTDPSVIQKWDLQSGRLLGAIKRRFESLQFDLDRNSVLILSDKTARIWGADDNLEGSHFLQARQIKAQAITPDGKTLLGAVNDAKQFQFWDVDKATPLAEPVLAPSELEAAWISDDGKYAVTAESGLLAVWQAGKREPFAHVFDVPPAAAAFSNDGKLFGWAAHLNLKTLALATGSKTTLEGHTDRINDLAMTRTVALTGGDDKTAMIWDLSTGQARYSLMNEDDVKAVALSPDGRLALTGCNDGTIQLWNVQTGGKIGNAIKVNGPIEKIRFSNNASLAAVETSSWIYVFRTAESGLSYERAALIADPWKPLFTFGPDGSKIRFAYQFGDNAIQIQDLDLYSDDLKLFNGDSHDVLGIWSKRLGFKVGELGEIAKLWQDELLPDETDQDQESPKSAAR